MQEHGPPKQKNLLQTKKLLLHLEKECENIFTAIEEKKVSAKCSYFSIHSICIFAAYSGKQKETIKFLEYLSNLENLSVEVTTILDDKKILFITEQTGLDFDDALQYHIAKETQCKAIITLDEDFKKTKIKAQHPKELNFSAL